MICPYASKIENLDMYTCPNRGCSYSIIIDSKILAGNICKNPIIGEKETNLQQPSQD